MAADLVYSTPCILCPLILLLLLFYSFNNFSAKTSAPPSSLSNTSSEMISPNIPGAVKDDHFCNTSTDCTNSVQKDLHRKSRIETMEEGLARARAAIRKAIRMRNYTSYKKESFVPRGSIYLNPYAFHQLSSSIYRHDLQFRLIFGPKVEIYIY
ncbi:hypothetical protein OIU77_005304 [Salix suchowensis]|uniref:Uncharacterized protein n=1 Tax=Salix suchowensis TaxID=1278906 RepID=A0ABQ9AR13_9ROSI|nr:hypothetical protein OIU77_005304 [Salix suchowensis]